MAVVIDRLAAHIAPPVNRREVQDGVRDLRNSNPDVLVLGSSHARTFHEVGQQLAARTSNGTVLVDVPVENGKLVAYEWVLRHRLVPLIEERDENGSLRRDRLRRFVLLTEWWDSCAPTTSSKLPYTYWNLPSRAWTFGDFLSSVWQDGLNGYNRNYLQNRLRRWLAESALIYDRTQGVLMWRAIDWLHGKPPGRSPEEKRVQDEGWQQMVERGNQCIKDPQQMAALEHIVDYALQRGLDVTVVLFPRKPITITQTALNTTIHNYELAVRDLLEPRGVRVLDMTLTSPLTDADFMDDNDHVNAEGNRKFARWALDRDLQFLFERGDAIQASGTVSGAGR